MSILPVDQVDEERWHQKRRPVALDGRETLLRRLIEELVDNAPLKGDKYQRIMRLHPVTGKRAQFGP